MKAAGSTCLWVLLGLSASGTAAITPLDYSYPLGLKGVYINCTVKYLNDSGNALVEKGRTGRPEKEQDCRCFDLSYLGKGVDARLFDPPLGRALSGWDGEGTSVAARVSGYLAGSDFNGMYFTMDGLAQRAVSLVFTEEAGKTLGLRPLSFRPMSSFERAAVEKQALPWAKNIPGQDGYRGADSWVNDEIGLRARLVDGGDNALSTHYWYKGREFEFLGFPEALFASKMGILLKQGIYFQSILVDIDGSTPTLLLESLRDGGGY